MSMQSFRFISQRNVLGLAAVLSLATLVGAALATDHHHDASQAVASKGKGTHTVLKTKSGAHAVAHVGNNKLVTNLVAKDKKGKALNAKKFKKKVSNASLSQPGTNEFFMVANLSASGDVTLTAASPSAEEQGFGCMVGWGFYCTYTQVTYYVWFRMDQVQGGDSGCSPYGGNNGGDGGDGSGGWGGGSGGYGGGSGGYGGGSGGYGGGYGGSGYQP